VGLFLAKCCGFVIIDPPVFMVVLSSQTVSGWKLQKIARCFGLAQKGTCKLSIGDFVFAEKDKDNLKKKEKESTFHPHHEIVVTATMTSKAVKDCSASISVISTDDLKALTANNALNLLNIQPGIFIHRTGDFGRADVDIRGIGQRGQRIAVLVDGRPEKMVLFGCAVTHAFPLDNVERIEVVRGPSSVLYG
jgi:outer membrane cobalamin receptor